LTLSDTSQAVTAVGNDANNELTGNSQANFLDGGVGIDLLIGGMGDDTYIVDNVDDVVVENASSAQLTPFGARAFLEGIDTVRSSVSYTLSENVENLTLTGAAAIDGTGNELANNLIGNSAANVLSGGGDNDTFIGGAGNDTLRGGTGNDIYLFNLGDGVDTITDTSLPGEGNTVEFGAGIAPTDLSLGVGSLLIRVGTNGDAIHLTNFDPTNVLGPRTIESFRFADGTGLSYDQLVARGFDLTGTAGHDTITGTNVVDQINGLAGDDTIQAGAGEDLLNGGAGSDSYIYNLGDGIDTIDDTAAVGAGNRLQFGAGISQTGLTFTRDEVARTLTIDVGGSGTDQLVLTNFDLIGANGSLVVETLAFADGSTASLSALLGGPVNHAPTVATPLADQMVPEDAPFSIAVPANTFADQDANDVLTLSASLADGTALPAWLTFDATTRTFTGTPDDAQVGSLDLKVTATDTGTLSAADTFTLTVTNVNEVPTVAAPLTDQQATEDAPFTFVVQTSTFADVDQLHGDQLTYSATREDGTALPSWLSFDATTRTFSGIPLNSDVGTLALRVTATDIGNLSVSDTFSLTVTNVNDAPTVAAPLADQTGNEDEPFSFTIAANTFADADLIHGDVLTYSATLADGSTLPTWLSFNPTTRTLSGTPGNGDVGVLALTVTATDTGNLSAATGFALTIQNVNDAPTVAVPLADQQATQGTPLSVVVPANTFADVDAGDTLTYTAAQADGTSLPTWLSFDPLTRTFSGTPQSGDVGTLDVRVTATDQGTLSVADVFALTIAPSGGTAGNDTLIGTDGDDTLSGLAGNDTLTGGEGQDLLDGGTGNDTMQGGTGNDTYIVDVAVDVVTELANEGTDTVQSSITYTLGANVENLTLTGTANLNSTGNVLDNILTGNSGANVLTGGAGNDTYVVGAGDTVVEQAGGGTDRVESAITYMLGSNVEHLTLTGTTAINGTGNTFANVLLGNSVANALTGGGGDDTLDGGDGNDVLDGGTGNDALVGGLGHDTLSGGGNVDTLDGGAGDDNLDGGDGNDALTGGIGDDQLTGGGEADTLDGGEGHDTLDGGAGNDILLAGQGNDILIGGGNADTLDAGDGDDSLDGGAGNDILLAGAGNDQLIGGGNADTLDGGSGNDTLDGVAGDDILLGGEGDDTLLGGGDHDVLDGGTGNDILEGAAGDDLFHFKIGYGQDTIQNPGGGTDRLQFGTDLNPLQLILSRQVNDLRIAVHGSADAVTVRDWYTGTSNQTEVLQAGNGQQLLNTQVDQLIQAMAGFTAQTGLTWDQAIDQQPQQVQTVLAASWQ
jgi:Ca2+-binding RTX toxin-like protein